MKGLMLAVLTALAAAPLLAQHRVDVLVDAEGAHRPGRNAELSTGVHFDPQFGTGGGARLGLNFFLTDRVSIEAKAAALESRSKSGRSALTSLRSRISDVRRSTRSRLCC